jgi:hypothetical protein
MIIKRVKQMNYNNPLYIILLGSLITACPTHSMNESSLNPDKMTKGGIWETSSPDSQEPVDLTQSTIWGTTTTPSEKQLSQLQNIITTETLASSPKIDTSTNTNDQEYIAFKQIHSNLPHELDRLRFTKAPIVLQNLKESITKNISTLISFIEKRDISIINPESSERIKKLTEIKEEITKNIPLYTDMLINQWKNIIEKSCSLTITNIEKIKSGDTSNFEKSSLHFDVWPNTPEEQIDYLNKKNWNLNTKTYILQLLWWNTRKTLDQAKKTHISNEKSLKKWQNMGKH